MKNQMCDHFWEYKKGTKDGVDALCEKCGTKRHFSWFEWKKMLGESKKLGTTRFH